MPTNIAGATELLGHFSGIDYNLPVYALETQVPSLGIKYQCVDSKGHPIVGKEGELVLTVPTPLLLIYLWKDENKELLKKTYLAKYPDVPSKRAFGFLERKLEFAASNVACNTMKEAALEIRSNETDTEFSQCGVSVDGTWQRRGYSSLNGCVSVISIDSGKVLDVEFMSKVCRDFAIPKTKS
ncbi:acetoacetyl-CoA synthetase [Trichonephila clavipes]|nr:acetoacetyl-CoA synthetase [Trichonephila clavipes]